MGFFHLFGSLCLLAATVLLVIASVGTPVWTKIDYYRSTSAGLSMGQWGLCLASSCTKSKLGYDLSSIESIVGTSTIASGAIKGLTYAFILNPIAAGLSVLALLLSLGSCLPVGILASLFAFFTFLVTLVAFAIDIAFALIARNRLRDDANINGSIGKGVWLVLAAAILQLLASVTVCWTRHSSYKSRGDKHARGMSDNGAYENQHGYAANGAPMTQTTGNGRRFGFFGRKNQQVATY